MAQGFLFSRPITGDEMLALLQRSDATAAGTAWWAGASPLTQRRRRDSDVVPAPDVARDRLRTLTAVGRSLGAAGPRPD